MPGQHSGSLSRPKIVLLLVAGVMVFAMFCGLGVWQLQRLQWKVDLISRVEHRIHAKPTGLEAIATLEPTAQEYRRVRVAGRFDNSRETLVMAVTELGSGFWVITPLRTSRGQTVLVNRGFIKSEMRAPSDRKADPVTGETTVTGLVRLSEPGGGFLRHNDPASDRWYSRDVQAIAAARHLGPVENYFIDAERSTGYPVGGLTVVRFRNDHLIYAITWFGLALLSGYGVSRLFRDMGRKNRSE